jgi:hypothetical protein
MHLTTDDKNKSHGDNFQSLMEFFLQKTAGHACQA